MKLIQDPSAKCVDLMQIPWIPRLWCLHYSLLYAMTSYGFRKKLFIGKTYTYEWHFTMWHTTEMFQGTSVPTLHPHVLYHPNKTCPVADHELFISLFTLHTPFLMLCRSLLSNQCNLIISSDCRDSVYQRHSF